MTSIVLRSPWTRDVAVAVGMFVLGLMLIRVLPEVRITWGTEAPDPEPRLVIAVLAVACIGEIFRRQVPIAALALGTAALAAGPFVVGETDMATVLVFFDVLYCAVLYTGRTVSRVVCFASGVVVVGLTVTALVFEGGRGGLQALLNMMLVVVPVLWGSEVRRHRDLADVERSRAAQASRMAEMDRRVAVATERARMARDLHDIVAGQLSAIALQSEAALDGRDPELRERVLRGVRAASVSALAEMRTMIGLLREAEPDSEPRTAPARLDQLDPLLASARAWGLRVRVRDERPAGADCAAGTELAAYRVVQEGLTNVAKHAPGADVTVLLRHADDRLEVRVENGPSRSAPACHVADTAAGSGLDGLTERAGAVGGTLHAGPHGGGWRVQASLPLGGTPATPQHDGQALKLG